MPGPQPPADISPNLVQQIHRIAAKNAGFARIDNAIYICRIPCQIADGVIVKADTTMQDEHYYNIKRVGNYHLAIYYYDGRFLGDQAAPGYFRPSQERTGGCSDYPQVRCLHGEVQCRTVYIYAPGGMTGKSVWQIPNKLPNPGVDL